MPRKTKTAETAHKAAQPQIPAEYLKQLIPGQVTPAQFEDIFQRFKKSLMEQAARRCDERAPGL
jgi:hypothetical protein